ncbi:MAG: hypothetical protein ABIP39_07655 [Polyangiaceae bacterium]
MASEAFLPAVFDPAGLPAPALRLLDVKTPMPMRQMAAKGVSPGLKPHEALSVVVLLSQCPDHALAATASDTLRKLPPALVGGALVPQLHAAVLDIIAPLYATDTTMMEKILSLPQLALATIAYVAGLASEMVCELIATNEERLLAHGAIIERLYMNKHARMSTADRILELAVRNGLELTGIPAFKEAAAAIANELIVEAQEEPTFDDVLFKETEELAQKIVIDPEVEDTHVVDPETGEEIVEEKFLPLHAQLAQMSVSQKVRRAMLGTATERMVLVRDANRLVAAAAIKSPMIQENEVVRISASRSVSDDVLRLIAMSREWTRSHQVKVNLVANPRTPFAFAAKLIAHLREHELKNIAKSKNVTGAVSTAAKNQLAKRGGKG